MNKNKSRVVYESRLYDVFETIEILKKCPADIRFKLYHKIRKELVSSMGKSGQNQLTLNKVVKMMNAGFKQDRKTLKQIITTMNDGFKQDRETLKQIITTMNTGFEQINTRLDYIVKANNLKDLPKNR